MANSLMALSRERIADELMKLLALPDPSPVLKLMIEGGVLAPVLPEIGLDGLVRLERLLRKDKDALASPSPLIRLGALLPQDAAVGEQVAARLKLSNKARKRVAAALAPPPAHENPFELAFRVGQETATDQLLLGNGDDVADIRALRDWTMPEFPIGGRDLLQLGVEPGPAVAQILGIVRDRWIAEGFPDRVRARTLAADYISEFRRESQKS
mgnify:FL=1